MLKFTLIICFIFLFSCANRQTVNLQKQEKTASQVIFQGGNGESIEDAVIITGAFDKNEGVDAEYNYISTKHGLRNKDWRLHSQTIVKENGKMFDVLEIELIPSSQQRIYYFDVSVFPWKKQ